MSKQDQAVPPITEEAQGNFLWLQDIQELSTAVPKKPLPTVQSTSHSLHKVDASWQVVEKVAGRACLHAEAWSGAC